MIILRAAKREAKLHDNTQSCQKAAKIQHDFISMCERHQATPATKKYYEISTIYECIALLDYNK